jgi:hypothetical protein
MTQTTSTPEIVPAPDTPTPNPPERQQQDAVRLRRARQSRAWVLLSSFPTRVFLLALACYLALTWLYVWASGALLHQAGAPGMLDFGGSARASAAAWARFDSYFFLHIAQFSYTDQGLGAFFPLYPLLIRLFAWPLFGHFTLAALLVSWLCAWGSYLWFYRLAEREFGERVARFALLFLALSPVSFFSFAPYSESLFLLVSIGAVERARAGRLWQASALAALGMLTRPTGILLLLPLAWEWGRRNQTIMRLVIGLKARLTRQRASDAALVVTEKPLPRLAWLSLGLVPLALLGYMLFLKLHNGNALAFLAGESAWHRHFTLPWTTVGLFADAFQRASLAHAPELYAINILDLLLVIPLPLWVLYSSIRQKKLWLGSELYKLALTLMLIAVPTYPAQIPYEVLLSTERFMLPAFPIFLLLGQFGVNHPRLARALLVASAALLLLNTARFLAGNFIA